MEKNKNSREKRTDRAANDSRKTEDSWIGNGSPKTDDSRVANDSRKMDESRTADNDRETSGETSRPAQGSSWRRDIAVAAVIAAALCLLQFFTENELLGRREQEARETMGRLIPGGEAFAREEYSGGDQRIRAVWRGQGGYVIETATEGYAGEVVLWVGLDDGGTVRGLAVRRLNETMGLGFEAARDREFLDQFIGTAGDAALGVNIDGLTGATVTSRAVERGVSAAAAFVTGADVVTAPTKWGG